MHATWTSHESDERVVLRVELGNDHAVTLTCSKNGDEPPTTTLWAGNGERPFGDATQESFRQWIAEATPKGGQNSP
jgi:hypothetical protein